MGNVDIRPDQACEGGGLIDDFDGIITDMRFVMTDYDGALTEAVPVCRVVFDVEGEEFDALYSVGGKGDFGPDETGRGLNKLRSKALLTKTCKYIKFSNSLVESGFPLNRMDGHDVSSIIGTKGHFLRQATDYTGITKKKDDDRPATVLLCTKILELPGEEKGKAKGRRSAAKDKSAPAPANTELSETVAGIVQGLIIEHDGEVAKKDIVSAMFKNDEVNAMDIADKKVALKLASNDTFLKEREEWTFEDGLLKMV